MIQPAEVTAGNLAFPATVIGKFLPPKEEIPEEFRENWQHCKWSSLAQDWFYEGLPADVEFHMKDGVDGAKAFRHLSVCLRSYEPSHQHKIAGVAYLMDCWMEKVEIPSKQKVYP